MNHIEQQDKADKIHNAKVAAAKEAADMVQADMLVGLGTGSTALEFIKALAQRCRAGLYIEAIATSVQSALLATEEGITLMDSAAVTKLDLAVDGADQVDDGLNLVKGAGGALLREKVVAAMSDTYIIIVDESKISTHLGPIALPVEVLPYGSGSTLYALAKKGWQATLRTKQDKSLYVSDNGNYIVDIAIDSPILDPNGLDASLRQIPGILQTGLFIGMTDKVLVGNAEGQVRTIYKK